MDLKVFDFPDVDDEDGFDWGYRVAVLYRDKHDRIESEAYVIDADTPNPYTLYAQNIDDMIEILQWIKQDYASRTEAAEEWVAVESGNASRWEPPAERVDSAGAREEEG